MKYFLLLCCARLLSCSIFAISVTGYACYMNNVDGLCILSLFCCSAEEHYGYLTIILSIESMNSNLIIHLNSKAAHSAFSLNLHI